MDLVIAEEGAPPMRLQQRMGQLPIMVKSHACYLRNLSQYGLHTSAMNPKENRKHKVQLPSMVESPCPARLLPCRIGRPKP